MAFPTRTSLLHIHLANEIQYSHQSLQVLFAVVTLVLVSFLPESPRWLANQGRTEEAREVIYMLDTSPVEKRSKSTVRLGLPI